MPSRKRAVEDAAEPVAKRRSTRQAAAAAASLEISGATGKSKEVDTSLSDKAPSKLGASAKKAATKKTESKTTKDKAKSAATSNSKSEDKVKGAKSAPMNGKSRPEEKPRDEPGKNAKQSKDEQRDSRSRAASEDPDVDSIPTINPEAPRHDGEWYWLMKAEPETRYENGIDVRFSIDDLRGKDKPEGWDGIRAYAARNNMRNMNAGDKAFFYHSNCKEPCIAGIMEIVKEFSEDKSARRPGTPYYDPQSTRENPRWSLVHVEFRKKFAVPITLKELRELGHPGGPLTGMQLLKQSRLSVTRVSSQEWKALCDIADQKAKDAGLEHVKTKSTS